MNPLLTLPQLSLAAVLLAAAPLGFAAPYESAPRVYLDQLLPGTLIRSGNHRVLSEIRPQRNTIEFEIESDYGFYRVRSIPMVIQRVHEIRTLAQAVNHYHFRPPRIWSTRRPRTSVRHSRSFTRLRMDRVLADRARSPRDQYREAGCTGP